MRIGHGDTEDTENCQERTAQIVELSEINQLTERIIGCAIEVHRNLGPGLLESVYEAALCVELSEAGLSFRRQVIVPVLYKERRIGEHRIDLLVEDEVVVEVKGVEKMNPLFEAQLLSYLKVAKKRVGLLVNFNSGLLRDGVKRLIL